jgi:ankyrin repeat protein
MVEDRNNREALQEAMSENQNQFTRAIQSGDAKIVAEMLADGRADANAAVHWFGTALHLVVHRDHGDITIAKLLLDAGARINDVDRIGVTPLLAAVRANAVAMVELFIACGADVALEDVNHLSPLLVAMLKRNESNIYALLKAGAPLGTSMNPNDAAVVCGAATLSTRVLRLMIDRREQLIGELCDVERRTPCHHLAARPDTPQADVVLRMLVNEAHIDINARNHADETCAHVCAMHGHTTALLAAIELGADIDARDRAHRTPLMQAVANVHMPCVYLLLAAGADASQVCGRFGETLCHFAVDPFAGISLRLTRSPHQMLCTAIAAGANFDAPDDRGTSARAYADKQGIRAPTEQDIIDARRLLTVAIVDRVRKRALEVCCGLQPLNLDALQTCEVLQHACVPWNATIPFHTWWTIATTVKHFQR